MGRGGLTVSFNHFAFCFRDVVDPSSVNLMSGTEKTLPACDGIRSYDWAMMHVSTVYQTQRESQLTEKL
jgi:hypothetical protein